MEIEHLDYEGTLRALQEHVGTRVSVSFADAETEFNAGSVVGVVHAAAEMDYAAMLPVLEGRLSGETMYFVIVDTDHPQTTGGFGIWRDGFSWGRRVQGVTGPAVHYCINSITVRVMPIPQGMLPIDQT